MCFDQALTSMFVTTSVYTSSILIKPLHRIRQRRSSFLHRGCLQHCGVSYACGSDCELHCHRAGILWQQGAWRSWAAAAAEAPLRRQPGRHCMACRRWHELELGGLAYGSQPVSADPDQRLRARPDAGPDGEKQPPHISSTHTSAAAPLHRFGHGRSGASTCSHAAGALPRDLALLCNEPALRCPAWVWQTVTHL